MGQIDRYVNSVYRHISGNKEEIKVLKEEMKNHLLQLVEELKSKGKSEDESISIAIKQFGEKKQIENELLGIFKFSNKKAKKTLIVAIAFFIMTIISFSIVLIGTEVSTRQYLARNKKIVNILSSYNKDNIDDIDKNISKIFNESKGQVVSVMMYHALKDEYEFYPNLKDLEYAYPKGIQCKHNNCIGQQISNKKGVKYDVSIGQNSYTLVPMYIKNFKKISLIFLCCFIISVIAWILVKIHTYIYYRY
ncbi:hypothetical protein FDJ70_09765 [Clostridium botulinum]|uniref:Uncharacterized protein n=2 Tax=Clostridium botulinum TaxID=1491 RepID=C4B696_CLOBO|nr:MULTISPECIES: permease prefix domain 1-containing protein [Clostridium]ACT33669.1 conserved hypothetical protein [Clostridium botulinum D str. 1873]AYF55323.1 hypothetical protein DFH04_11370 [Clostridium novyi]MBO3442913.1 hypothetical protein [Clostridium haemolyticum]NFV47938.1 hypothetical protein [Clostridium botulinum]BAH29455.1 hypothetical protein [Clostridium botulinum]